MKIISNACLYTIVALIISCSKIFAATPPKYHYRVFRASLMAKHLITANNFGSQGQVVKLPTGHSFSHTSAKGSLLYALSHNWAISSAVHFAYGSSEDSVDLRTNAMITDIELASYYKIIAGPVYILPQLRVSIPIEKYTEDSDKTIINEGVLAVEFGTWLETIVLGHRLFSYGGYLYQSDGRAHLIPYEIGVYNSVRRFIYGLSLKGNIVANEDINFKMPSKRTSVTNKLNGGSLAFYSVDPEETKAKLWLGTRLFKNSIVYLKYEKSLFGKSTAEHQTVMLEYKMKIFNPKKRKKAKAPKFNPDGLDLKDLKAIDALGNE